MGLSRGEKFGIGALGGGLIGGGLTSLFGNYDNPADAANPYLQQISGAIKPYYEPYTQAGQQAIPTLQEQFQKLLQNPQGIMGQIGAGYQQSPGYQFQRDQSLQGINNAAAAGGMLGSQQHQQQAGELAGNLANQDYNNYLGHALNLYGLGLGGFQGLEQGGQQAGHQYSSNLAQSLISQANNAYEGRNAQNQAEQGGLGSLIGGAASIASLFI